MAIKVIMGTVNDGTTIHKLGDTMTSFSPEEEARLISLGFVEEVESSIQKEVTKKGLIVKAESLGIAGKWDKLNKEKILALIEEAEAGDPKTDEDESDDEADLEDGPKTGLEE